MDDGELLRAYVEGRSEEAFGALIERYVRLVYGACLRQLGDRHLAEDATQGVFVLLSEKAGELRRERMAGWLLTAARFACVNIRKRESRRERREKEAGTERAGFGQDDMKERGELLEMLDEGLCALGGAEREAVVLRYLEERPLCEVGAAMGITEEAARKRVMRGVEKLRGYFRRRRGLEVGVGLLAAVVAEHARAGVMEAGARELVVRGIWGACHAGAGSAGAAAVATGVDVMMWAMKVKLAVKVGAVVVLGGVVAGLVFMPGTARRRKAPEAPAMAAPAAATEPLVTASIDRAGGAAPRLAVAAEEAPKVEPAKAREVMIDRSTPEKTLESLAMAVKAGDRAKTYMCLNVDPKREPEALDYFLADSLAQNHLIEAARRKLGGSGEFARASMTIDQALAMFALAGKLTGEKAEIEGDAAILKLGIPDEVLETLREGMSEEDLQTVKNWSGMVVHFVKVEGTWRVDCDRTMAVRETLQGNDDHEITDPAVKLAAARDSAAAMESVAADLPNMKGLSEAEVKTLIRTRDSAAMSRYDAKWLYITVVPVGGGR